MTDYNVVNAMGCFPGHGHYVCVAVGLISAPDIFVGQFSLRAQHYSCLHGINLLLAGKEEVYEIDKFRVLWVNDTKLLIQGVGYSV